jgi:hypothetical protein
MKEECFLIIIVVENTVTKTLENKSERKVYKKEGIKRFYKGKLECIIHLERMKD